MTTFAKVNNSLVERVIVAQSSFFDIRKNYAGIGYSYDAGRDAFIPQKPYPSWTLDEDTCQWLSPTPYPDDGKKYIWNESTQVWDEVS